MPGWRSYKPESRHAGGTSTTSDMQMIDANGRKRRGIKGPLDEGEAGE